MRISKSKFVAGMQCLKRLYLQIRQPELGAEQGAAAEAIIKQGREVGMLARQLFRAASRLAARADSIKRFAPRKSSLPTTKSRRSSKEYSNTMESSSGWTYCNVGGRPLASRGGEIRQRSERQPCRRHRDTKLCAFWFRHEGNVSLAGSHQSRLRAQSNDS